MTGGDDGILSIWPAEWASPRIVFYYLTIAIVVAGLLFLRRAVFSPFGFIMRAGRDSPLRAGAIGVNLRQHQWFAFALSGGMAGLAGALFLYSKGSIFPTEMEIARSFDALLMVLFGGVQSLSGPIVGATAFTWIEDLLSSFEYWRLLMGLAIIFLVLLSPNGLAGFGRTRLAQRMGFARPEEVAA